MLATLIMVAVMMDYSVLHICYSLWLWRGEWYSQSTGGIAVRELVNIIWNGIMLGGWGKRDLCPHRDVRIIWKWNLES